MVERLHSDIADAAPRQVDDTLEGEVVVGLEDDPEISDGVTDFAALIETRATDDPIGQAQGDEPFLEFAELEPGPHEDGDLAQRVALALQGLDLFTGHAGFLFAVPDPAQHHLGTRLFARPQGLAEPPLVMCDKPRGGAQNMRGGAVILFQPHHLGAGVVLLETQDVADFGPAPAVDGLVVVAHATDVVMAPRQKAKPQILGHVGILVFVHEDIAEAFLIVGEHVSVFGKQGQAV